jgi:hypothetical protein
MLRIIAHCNLRRTVKFYTNAAFTFENNYIFNTLASIWLCKWFSFSLKEKDCDCKNNSIKLKTIANHCNKMVPNQKQKYVLFKVLIFCRYQHFIQNVCFPFSKLATWLLTATLNSSKERDIPLKATNLI